MIKVFDKKLFISLSIVFVFATVIGTLSHESGHFIVAKALGYKAKIRYAFTHWDNTKLSDSIAEINEQYGKQLKEEAPFPRKEEYNKLVHKYFSDNLWMSMGGPLQTLLTGTIGLILLFVWKKSFKARQKLKPRQWGLIFITLFWLRQTANLVVSIGVLLLTKRFPYSDEIGIARRINLPYWSLLTVTGAIGAIILYIVIFTFIPKPQRLTFVLSGMTGGITGYFLWLYWLGPILIP